MTRRRRRALGASIGLLLLAAPIAPSRAQTTTTSTSTSTFVAPAECGDPPPDPIRKDMRIDVASPSSATAYGVETVGVSGHVTNESSRPIVGANGTVRTIDVHVLACRDGQLTPPSPDRITADQREVDFETPPLAFKTNGPYAVVIEAAGDSTDNRKQSARTVVPIKVAVPPRKPTDVSASPPANGVVTVSWSNEDREPDLVAYEVRRTRQGTGDYVTVKNGLVEPTVHAVADSPPVGAWRYHVVAYRADVPDGAPSRDATVEVAEPPPAGSGGGTGSGDGGTTATTGADGSSSASGTTPGSATRSSSGSAGTVDLSDFAALLNARRAAAAAPKRVEPPDPGFQETLPFGANDQLGEPDGDPAELGADEPNVGLGQSRLASDPSERRRSLGFVAFGLLLFVLSMTGLFVKAEVKRADLLDLDPIATDPPAPEPVPATAAPAAVAAAAVGGTARRRTRGAAPAAAPTAVVAAVPSPPSTNGARRLPRALPRAKELANAMAEPAVDDQPPEPNRRRLLQRAGAAWSAVSAGPDVVTSSAPEPTSNGGPPQAASEAAIAAGPRSNGRRRPRPSAVLAASPTPPAPADETTSGRRRLRRPAAATADPAPNGHHGFADLVEPARAGDDKAAPTASRRRPDPPLDAPGLDVPDPPTQRPKRVTRSPNPTR